MIWTIIPKYVGDRFVVGATLQGSSKYFTQDNNDLRQDGYNLIHLFGTYDITQALSVSLNINNVTDEFVVTETEDGSASVGSIFRGRPLSGTSTVLGFRFEFD